jgi:hypothetical protein
MQEVLSLHGAVQRRINDSRLLGKELGPDGDPIHSDASLSCVLLGPAHHPEAGRDAALQSQPDGARLGRIRAVQLRDAEMSVTVAPQSDTACTQANWRGWGCQRQAAPKIQVPLVRSKCLLRVAGAVLQKITSCKIAVQLQMFKLTRSLTKFEIGEIRI